MKPLVPEDLTRALPPPGRHFARWVTAHVLASVDRPAATIVEQRWQHDAVVRGATAPTDTGAGLARTDIRDDFLQALAQVSGAAALIDAGIKVNLRGIRSLSFPVRSPAAPATNMSWIVEGGPIPIRQSAFGSVTLGPTKKLAAGATATRELLEASGGEIILRNLLVQDAAASLDAKLFSADAATASAPPGLRFGVSAIPAATTTSTAGDYIIATDLANLSGAIAAAVGGVGNIRYFASVKTTELGLRYPRARITPVFGLADGIVVAVDASRFASFVAGPRVESSDQSIVHMEDTTPLAIGTVAGPPNTVAAPVRSLWQTDTIGVRAILDFAYAVMPGAVQWVTGVAW